MAVQTLSLCKSQSLNRFPVYVLASLIILVKGKKKPLRTVTTQSSRHYLENELRFGKRFEQAFVQCCLLIHDGYVYMQITWIDSSKLYRAENESALTKYFYKCR